MTKEEFLSRLKENKTEFKDAEELVKYMLPVLQHYLENYQETWYDMDVTKLTPLVDFSKITITESYTPNSINAMEVAFMKLQKRIKEFE